MRDGNKAPSHSSTERLLFYLKRSFLFCALYKRLVNSSCSVRSECCLKFVTESLGIIESQQSWDPAVQGQLPRAPPHFTKTEQWPSPCSVARSRLVVTFFSVVISFNNTGSYSNTGRQSGNHFPVVCRPAYAFFWRKCLNSQLPLAP